MHGARRPRQALAKARGQGGRARVHRLGQARRRLAGGRGQRDARLRRQRQQAGEQVDDGRRLARSRTAADDQQPLAQRERRRHLLPVGRGVGIGSRVEERAKLRRDLARERLRIEARRAHEALRQAPFEVEVAVQVDAALVVDDERAGAGRLRRTDDARGAQPLQRLRQRVLAAGQRLRERHADVAGAGGARKREAERGDLPGKRRVGAECRRPALQLRGQALRERVLVRRRLHGSAFPSNSAESSASSAAPGCRR